MFGEGANRRHFLRHTLTAGVVGMSASVWSANQATASKTETEAVLKPGATVLFQGDSITDARRNRSEQATPNSHDAFGNGYAWFAAASLLVNPEWQSLKFYNRGIGGNKVYQLANRWQSDALNLKPDVLSVLIGVNDFLYRFMGRDKRTSANYESDYRALLVRTREVFPEVKFVVCEPFVLRCGLFNDEWLPQFNEYRAAAKRVADSENAVFVPFQSMFDEAVKFAPPEHWAEDGVHPTASGAALMATTWLKHVLA